MSDFGIPNPWRIPELHPQEFGMELMCRPLARFRDRRRGAIGHFFMIDRQFECVWNQPNVYVKLLRRYRAVCTPDFSLYRDDPPAWQMYNVYRNRWCGRFWQEHGINVIPTVRWSTPQCDQFCFTGIPTGQIVATGTPDLRDPITRRLFIRGFETLFDILKPLGLILYGIPPTDFRYGNWRRPGVGWPSTRTAGSRFEWKSTGVID